MDGSMGNKLIAFTAVGVTFGGVPNVDPFFI